MDGNRGGRETAETGKAEKRTPRSIRFHDPEWERIEAYAALRGIAAAEFVRFAALAAVEETASGAGQARRLDPLIERTFRYSYMIATRMRDEMLAEGGDEELDALVGSARELQDRLLGGSSE